MSKPRPRAEKFEQADGVKLLRLLGVEISMVDAPNGAFNHTMTLQAKTIASTLAPYDLVRTMRASILVLGPILAREGRVPAAAADAIVDPTGCGDAYRGGLLYGLSQGWDWTTSARLGSVLGAMKIEHSGPQNHAPTRAGVAQRYAAAWGEPLPG